MVALTGSSGKTTVKEMIAAILREAAGSEEAVLATRGNLNNDIGVPLMLWQVARSHRAAVFELGMNHVGEIAYLAELVRPTVALVTEDTIFPRSAGKGTTELIIPNANLTPGDPNSFTGRAIIIHAKKDDGGQPVGNAGGRIGCGVIPG